MKFPTRKYFEELLIGYLRVKNIITLNASWYEAAISILSFMY